MRFITLNLYDFHFNLLSKLAKTFPLPMKENASLQASSVF